VIKPAKRPQCHDPAGRVDERSPDPVQPYTYETPLRKRFYRRSTPGAAGHLSVWVEDCMQGVPRIRWFAPVLIAGRYHLIRVLGASGSATAYLARDIATDEWRAVKVVDPGFLGPSRRDELYARFLRDAEIMSRLSHPNVVRVHDVFSVDGWPVVVSEATPGGSLAGWMERNGPLPPAQVMQIGLQCVSALAHVHARGVLHRGVKPSNLLVREDGSVALADTGIGLGTGTLMRQPSVRADVYALGVTLHTLCTGRRERELHLSTRPSALLEALPPGLADVITRCCRSEPGARRPRLADLHRRLAEALASCASTSPAAPDLAELVARFPGAQTRADYEAIEGLRDRLSTALPLDEHTTETFAPNDPAPLVLVPAARLAANRSPVEEAVRPRVSEPPTPSVRVASLLREYEPPPARRDLACRIAVPMSTFGMSSVVVLVTASLVTSAWSPNGRDRRAHVDLTGPVPEPFQTPPYVEPTEEPASDVASWTPEYASVWTDLPPNHPAGR
jgi:hypothetical protein